MDIKITEDVSAEYLAVINDILDNEEFRKLAGYIQHLKTTRLVHSLNVSYLSWKIARKLSCDERAAARAGLLHDFFLYRFSDPKPVKELQAFYHPKVAARNSARHFQLSEKEQQAILSHMFPLGPLPTSREAWIITCADKFCAAMELCCFSIAFARQGRVTVTAA